jgi:hypothetical protein
MPIQVSPTSCTSPIQLAHWSSSDLDLLARVIAWMILGRRAHAVEVLSGEVADSPELTAENIDEAIGHLQCPEKTRVDHNGNTVPHNSVIHRDGWLFQFISWIVARSEFPESIQKSAQPRKADKGFDGLLIELDGSSISAVLMVEDKATDDPRGTVTRDIWPEFSAYENGSRDNELTAEASTMLEQQGLDARELVKKARWFNTKRYRASIATSKASIPPLVHTFNGYDQIIGAGPDRRLANLLIVDDLRIFMDDLSTRIIDYLDSLRPADV